mgnify:CR=1 FL=1
MIFTMCLMVALLPEKEIPKERPPLEMVMKATSKIRVRTTPFLFAFLARTRAWLLLSEKKRRRAGAPKLRARMGIVLEIRQGMVNRGADISWLSQYPHERETLFGPLTGIEVR